MERGLKEVLDAIQRPSRDAKLAILLAEIERFRPDAWECHQIIDALGGSLRTNPKHLNPTEALVAMTLAMRALMRLDEGNEVDGYEELCAIQAYKDRELKRGD